jgi:hypothetical protein
MPSNLKASASFLSPEQSANMVEYEHGANQQIPHQEHGNNNELNRSTISSKIFGRNSLNKVNLKAVS